MKHPDKIISYQDCKFLEETFVHCITGAFDDDPGKKINLEGLWEDISRCIKILEDCKDAQ